MRYYSNGFASILVFVVFTSTLDGDASAQQTASPRPSVVLPELNGPMTNESLIESPFIEPPLIQRPSLDPGLSLEAPLEKFRRSFYQGSEVLGGYLFDLGDSAGGLDQTFEEARISFGLPLGSMDNILGLRPYFRADHFRGPDALVGSDPFDVPGTVYDTGVSILNQKKWSEVFSTTIIVSPSVRSDFRTSDNAFRLFGLALVNWQPRQELTISVGAVYFDRADFGVLPVVGVTYMPTPSWKIEATAPRPRISRRLWKQGGQAEGWAYIVGQIGGNTWAVKRDSGLSDELTVRGYQALAGYEVLRAGNRGLFIEGGYAFGRSIEYERQDVELELDDGISLRAGWQF